MQTVYGQIESTEEALVAIKKQVQTYDAILIQHELDLENFKEMIDDLTEDKAALVEQSTQASDEESESSVETAPATKTEEADAKIEELETKQNKLAKDKAEIVEKKAKLEEAADVLEKDLVTYSEQLNNLMPSRPECAEGEIEVDGLCEKPAVTLKEGPQATKQSANNGPNYDYQEAYSMIKGS